MGDHEERPAPSTGPTPAPASIVVELRGSIARAAIPNLCERTYALMSRCDREVVICDVSGLADPDFTTVDALARLQVTAKRLGHSLRLRGASPELGALIELAGLGEVLPVVPG